jgi:hypothetical protein
MDIVGIISRAIVDAIGLLLSGIVAQGIIIATVLYNGFIAENLLTPGEAFPYLNFNSLSGGEGSLYYFVMFNFYDPILTIILTALGLIYLLNASLELKNNLKNMWIKVLLILILSNISFFISQDLVMLGNAIYTQIYNFGGSRHNFHDGSNFLMNINLGPNPNTTIGIFIIVLVFFLVLFLLITLSIRLAIIFTFPILIPIFTIFLILPQTRDLGIKIWWLYIDAVFSPILIGIPLILATYSNNSSLILGFLALSDTIPFILMKEPSFIGNLGFLFGYSAESTAVKTIPILRNVSRDLKTVIAASGIPINMSYSARKNRNLQVRQSVRNYSSRNSRPPSNKTFFRVRP